MTVKELIARLTALGDEWSDAEVWHFGNNNANYALSGVEPEDAVGIYPKSVYID